MGGYASPVPRILHPFAVVVRWAATGESIGAALALGAAWH